MKNPRLANRRRAGFRRSDPTMAKRPKQKPKAAGKARGKKPLVRPFKARPHTTAKARKAAGKPAKARKPKVDYYGPGPSENPDLAGPIHLGPLVLPTNYDQALKLIEELAGLNDAVIQAEKKHADSAKVTKRLKGEWDEASKTLSDRLRQATHKVELPLFDQAERDTELKAMAENQVKPDDEKAPETAQEPASEAIGAPAGSQGVH